MTLSAFATEPTVPSRTATAIDRGVALRISAAAVGAVSLIATVLFVATPALGIAATVVSAVAIAIGAPAFGPWVRWRAYPHALAALLALLAIAGMCATRCGSFAAYERFGWMPTAVAGLVLHGAIAIAAFFVDRRPDPQGRAGRTVETAIAVAIGASLFYATVIVAIGGWCGSCGGIHAVMAVQAIAAIRSATLARVGGLIAVMLATAGGVNAVYHHGGPEVRDDPAELLAYLRGLWTEARPPQPVEQTADEPVDAERVPPVADRAGSRSRPPLADRGAATTPVASPTPSLRPDAVRRATSGISSPLAVPADPFADPGHHDAARDRSATDATRPVAATQPRSTRDPAAVRSAATATDHAAATADRAVADANRWGRRDAPVTMLVAIDTGCPACAGHFGQLLDLRDLVDSGRLQVRFLLAYRNDAAQATASLAYAAGFLGDAALVDALSAFYREQKRIVMPADALAALPPSLPRAALLAALRRHQPEVSALLGDAAKLKERLGTTSEPTTWLMPTGQADPARTFQGATLASILRLAALSLVPADARDLPTFTAPEAR